MKMLNKNTIWGVIPENIDVFYSVIERVYPVSEAISNYINRKKGKIVSQFYGSFAMMEKNGLCLTK